jgi:hypothetical protein
MGGPMFTFFRLSDLQAADVEELPGWAWKLSA